jgi:hypothetical protein
MRAPFQVSLPNFSTALPSPSFSATPGTSIPVDFLSEGLLAAENYSCTFFMQHPATTAD